MSAVNPLVAFYDIDGRKERFSCSVPDKHDKYIIIISLLKTPLLGHRPSLWITLKENGP
jgi:hypothetical protein